MKQLKKSWLHYLGMFIGMSMTILANAQTAVKLHGRVVEATPSGNKGVPKITVSVADFSYDITDEEGNFSIGLPTDRPMVQLQLENSPHKMISPLNGFVNLPPHTKSLEIIICGAQNKKLQEKVLQLNTKIAKLTKENNLSTRQAEVLQRTLLDTVLHFERYVETLKTDKTQTDGRIKVLEDSISYLVQALQTALGEKYIQQKVQYDAISSELQTYLDRLKDFRDKCAPEKINYYLVNQQAGNQLIATIEAYNQARDPLLQHHTTHTVAVRKLWDNPSHAAQLESLYNFILEDIHQKSILAIDQRVIEQIRKFATHQIARKKAETQAQDALSTLLPVLNAQISRLEQEITKTLYSLGNSL